MNIDMTIQQINFIATGMQSAVNELLGSLQSQVQAIEAKAKAAAEEHAKVSPIKKVQE